MIETISLLGVKVSRVDPDSASEQIFQWVRDRHRTYVCVAPVSTLVDARRDMAYKAVVNGAGMVTPDGMPVVWLAKAHGCRDMARTYGPDLMRLMCQKGQAVGLRHFFYGSTPQTLEHLQRSLKTAYPDVIIAGVYAPPFQPMAGQEQQAIVRRINGSRADVLWVGLGSPKQDFWMQLNRPWLDVPVIIGSGAAFDFVSGVKSQAPRWIQRSGLEWLFRLACEPRRLWKRYLVGNSLFIFYLIKDSFKRPSCS